MVEPAVKRTREDGQPQYARSIQRIADTAHLRIRFQHVLRKDQLMIHKH